MSSESDKRTLSIPDDILVRWQGVVNLLADLLHVPAALIMRVDRPDIEVLLASESANNPYHVGNREKLAGLYCERVIDSQEKLLIPNALADEEWKQNPDIERGMISYLGFPLLWPDDTSFGTICVLDSTENAYNSQYEQLLYEFKLTIETQLQLIFLNNLMEKTLAEQIQITHELRVQEIELAAIYENAPILMLLVDKEIRVRKVNQGVLELAQRPAEMLFGEYAGAVLQCVNATKDPRGCGFSDSCATCTIRNTILDTLRTGTRHYQVEAEVRLQVSPEPLSLLISSSLLDLPAGQQVLVCIEDITQRRRAEREREENAHRYQGLFEQTNDGVFIIGLDDTILAVNQLAADMLRYTVDELTGQSVEVVVAPSDLLAASERRKAIKSGGVLPIYERTFRRKNGDEFRVEINAALVRDMTGKPLYIQTIARDISERKQAEQALQASESRYRAIVEDQTEMICRYLPDGTYTFVNDAYCRYYGKRREELLGNKFSVLLSEEEAQNVWRVLNTLSYANPVNTIEHRIQLPDGEFRWQYWINRGIFNDQGDLIAIQAVGQDITERIKVEEERIQLATEQQRVQVLQQFLAAVPHDLMTPISVIRSSLYLAQQIPDERKRRIQINRIEDQVLLLQKMIENMIFMSRLDMLNSEDLERRRMNMNQLVQHLVEHQRSKADEKRQQITIDMPSQPILLSIDNDYFSTALVNLLDNAIQYTDEGGIITVTLARTEDQIVIAIQDTGCGIAQNDLPFIFDRFYRVQAHRPSGEGSGLGLSISRRIIELHGGQIEAESTLGKGSLFRVQVPFNRA